MDDFLEFIFELLFEIFGEIFIGLSEVFLPNKKLSKTARNVLKVISVLVGFIFFILLIIGVFVLVTVDKKSVLGLIFVIASGVYIITAVVLYANNPSNYKNKENIEQENDESGSTEPILFEIVNSEVYPILIKRKEKTYLTLFYWTEKEDSLLHSYDRILYFSDGEQLRDFCAEYQLNIVKEDEISLYDLDFNISSPIDYNVALCNWNLLNTIAFALALYFEGNASKYNDLYDFLFRLATPVEENDEATVEISLHYIKQLKDVFEDVDGFINKFKLYM